MFTSWESVERCIAVYSEIAGFKCAKKSMIQDVFENILSINFFCMDNKVFVKHNHGRLLPCSWTVTFSRSKNDDRIFVTKFNNSHNHETFTPIYQSEKWMRMNMIDSDLLQVINYRYYQRNFMNYQIPDDDMKNLNDVESIFEMVGKVAHPITLYPFFSYYFYHFYYHVTYYSIVILIIHFKK